MNMNLETVKIMIAVAGVATAVVCDWNMRKIPNAVTFPMMVFGLILFVLSHGVSGIGFSFLGLISGVLLLYLPFTLGGVGAGDVKLVGALGSILGPALVLQVFLASAVFGGIFSAVEMVRKKAVGKTCQNIKNKALYFLCTRKFTPEAAQSGAGAIGIPYAFAIGCGTLLILLVLKGG